MNNNNAIYNTIGQTYDATRKADPEIVEQLMQLINIIPNGKYLDIGCGSGNYTGALTHNGLMFEGIDISAEMLNKAKTKYQTIKFTQGSATNLPFHKETFDGAICILATHHINDNKKAFQEAFRVLKKES